jgi:TP901 family phage tail tape measure protein
MADDLNTRIGFDATEAINTLRALEQELSGYNDAIRAAADGTRTFNRAGKNFDKTVARMADTVARLTGATRGLAASVSTVGAGTGFSQVTVGLNGIADAQDTVKQSTAGVASQMQQASTIIDQSSKKASQSAKQLGQNLKEAGDKGAESGKAVLLSWQSVVRIFAIQTIHRAITLITNAFADGLREAVDYQVSLAEIQTIGGQLNLSMGELRETVRGISEQFAQPLDVVSEGLYQTLSNQVAEGAQNFEFLAAANKFAVAAVTDTASAVNLLSSTLNSYNISAADSEIVAGKLFKTIELGRIRGEEFANTFGRVTVLSSQLGISLEEVLASIATLTVQGLKYNEAFTLINNTTLKLIRPTENLQNAYNELGVASAEAGIQAFGFQGFLQKLSEQSGDTASEIGELFNRVRAIRGVLGLTGNATERFANNLREIQEASEIDLQKAFETIFETDAKQFEQELIRIKDVFTDTFGIGAVKTLNAFFGVFGGGVEAIQAFALAFAGVGLSYGAFALAVVAHNHIMEVSFVGFRIAAKAAILEMRAFLATPLGAALAIGAAIFTATAALNKYKASIREAAVEQKKATDIETRAIQQREQIRRDEVRKSEEEILAKAQKFLQEREKLYQQDAATAQRLQDSVFGSIADQVENRLGAYERFVKRVQDHAEGARDAIREIQSDLLAAEDKLRDFEFEISLEGLNDQQQIWHLISESQDRVRQSNEALIAGDKERAETLAQQAEELAKQARSTAKESGNRANIFKTTNQVRSALAQQVQIQKFSERLTKSAIEASKKIAEEEFARKVRIQDLIEQRKELAKIVENEKLAPGFDEEAARAKIKELTAIIEEEYRLASENAKILENYDPETKQLREKLEESLRDPLTGAKIDSAQLFDINFSSILAILRQQADDIPEGQKIAIEKLTGVKIDAAGTGEAQQALSKADDDARQFAKATQDLSAAQGTLSHNLADVRQELLEAFGSAQQTGLRAVASEAGGILGWFNDMAGAAARVGPALAEVTGIMEGAVSAKVDERLRSFQTRIAELGINAEEALSEENFNPQRAADLALELGKLGNEAQKAGFPKLAGEIRDVAKAVQESINAATRAAELKVIAEALKPQEDAIQNLGRAFDEVGDEATQAGNDAKSASNTAIQGLNAEADAANKAAVAYARKAAAARAGGGGGGEQVAHFGAIVRRQLGGLTFNPKTLFRQAGGQVGLDSVPVLAQPGESFLTAEATRKFFPQIQAMNAGVTPSFNTVDRGTTNNFGDVSIEVTEAASARDTAREVMKEIKRESRRQTFNLRRSR